MEAEVIVEVSRVEEEGEVWLFSLAQVEQEKIILLNTDVPVTLTLMWCSVG